MLNLKTLVRRSIADLEKQRGRIDEKIRKLHEIQLTLGRRRRKKAPKK